MIGRQNTFLHSTTATSVVDVGTGYDHFTTETNREEYVDDKIQDWEMDATTDEDAYLFHSVEPGCQGQCYFLQPTKSAGRGREVA